MRTHCCGNFETNQCCNDCPITAQLVRQQASYEAEIKVEIDAALERAAAEVVLLDKKHWFSKQSRFAEFLAYAIRALKESKE